MGDLGVGSQVFACFFDGVNHTGDYQGGDRQRGICDNTGYEFYELNSEHIVFLLKFFLMVLDYHRDLSDVVFGFHMQ